MNLMSTSPDPSACAQALDNRRLGSQASECVLICGDALLLRGHFGGMEALKADRKAVGEVMNAAGLYRAYNPYGRFAKWAAADWRHWWWAWDLGLTCVEEWAHRFGEIRAEDQALAALFDIATPTSVLDKPTTFPRCKATEAMPELDVHAAYRALLRQKWAESSPDWGRRGAPVWFREQS